MFEICLACKQTIDNQQECLEELVHTRLMQRMQNWNTMHWIVGNCILCRICYVWMMKCLQCFLKYTVPGYLKYPGAPWKRHRSAFELWSAHEYKKLVCFLLPGNDEHPRRRQSLVFDPECVCGGCKQNKTRLIIDKNNVIIVPGFVSSNFERV